MAIHFSNQGTRRASLQVNMTSMIDCVFLLIIFFVMVSRYISAENINVSLPNPEDSLAQTIELPNRTVLNCQFVPGSQDEYTGTARYQLGATPIDDLNELEVRLRQLGVERPEIQVVLRADRRLEYQYVRDAMLAIAQANIKNMNIAAELAD